MSFALIAKALGSGVEAAALTTYAKWRELLVSKESLADTFEDKTGSIAAYELLPVQELDELGERIIEVRVQATDGHRQLTAYFYARPGGAESAS
jgi:hypothetical protein